MHPSTRIYRALVATEEKGALLVSDERWVCPGCGKSYSTTLMKGEVCGMCELKKCDPEHRALVVWEEVRCE